MTTFDPSAYSITVRKVQIEDETHYEAVVQEMPGISAYEDSYADAYASVLDALSLAHRVHQEEGKPFPQPNPTALEEVFSGRVTLRMSRSLHAAISRRADFEGTSLNHWIVEAIAHRLGTVTSMHVAERLWATAIQLGTAVSTAQLQRWIGDTTEPIRAPILAGRERPRTLSPQLLQA